MAIPGIPGLILSSQNNNGVQVVTYWNGSEFVPLSSYVPAEVIVPPVITSQETGIFLDTSSPETFAFTPTVTTLCLVTMYIASRNGGTSSQAVQPSITYTDTTGVGPQTFGAGVIGTILGGGGGPLNSQNFIFPLLILGGTSLYITTAFVDPSTGDPIGTTFAYDFAVNISQAYPPV